MYRHHAPSAELTLSAIFAQSLSQIDSMSVANEPCGSNYVYGSEAFPKGMFDPFPLWDRAQARWESGQRAVAGVAVSVFSFRPGNYVWAFCYGFGVVVTAIREWRFGALHGISMQMS